MSQKSWGNRKKEASDYKAYFFFLTGTLICLLLGIWMESYVNQNLLCHVLEKMALSLQKINNYKFTICGITKEKILRYVVGSWKNLEK